MKGELLLDTNAAIALLGNNRAAADRLTVALRAFVPAIVIGELYVGAFRSARVTENVLRIDEVARSNLILDCDAETAKVYGAIEADLRHRGQPLPGNDVWIAALALQHDLTLLTRDAHFAHVASLPIESW